MEMRLESMSPRPKSDEPKGRGQTSIDLLNEQTYKFLVAKAAKNGTSLRKITNDILDMVRKKEEFLENNLPRFRMVEFHDDLIVIHDREQKVYAEVGLSDGYVHCNHDNSNDCEHVTYAYAVLELGLLEPKRKRSQ